MKNTAMIVLVAVIIAAAAFFIGSHVRGRFAYAPYAAGRFAPRMMRAPRMYGMMGRKSGGLVQGQITKIDGDTVTVQLPNGGTYTVTVSDQTAVEKMTAGTRTDLAVGQTISVYGGGYLNGTQTVVIGQ